MEEELICIDCGWIGDDTELHSKTEALDDNNFIYCPDCGSKDIEDYED